MKYTNWKLEILAPFSVPISVIILDKIFEHWHLDSSNIVKFFWGKGLLVNPRKFHESNIFIRVGPEWSCGRRSVLSTKEVLNVICYFSLSKEFKFITYDLISPCNVWQVMLKTQLTNNIFSTKCIATAKSLVTPCPWSVIESA